MTPGMPCNPSNLRPSLAGTDQLSDRSGGQRESSRLVTWKDPQHERIDVLVKDEVQSNSRLDGSEFRYNRGLSHGLTVENISIIQRARKGKQLVLSPISRCTIQVQAPSKE